METVTGLHFCRYSMSLFGSRRVITVGSTASHLMEYDEHHIDNAVLYSILQNQSLSKTLIDSDLQSMGAKMNAALRYAKDTYTLGLPNQYTGSSNKVSDATLASTITTDLGLNFGCVIDFNSISVLTSIAAILPYLLYEKGYDIYSGQVSNPPTAFVDDITTFAKATYPNQGVSQTYSVKEVLLGFDNTSVHIIYRARLSYTTTNIDHDVIHRVVPIASYTEEFTEIIQLATDLQVGSLYYIAGYRELDSLGAASDTVKWWYYSIESGKYPLLDPNNNGSSDSNAYPVVPIRYNNEFISTTNEPEIFDTGTELLKRMGVSFGDLVDGLSDNPDIALIDHAYVTLGVDLQTDNQSALSYLVEFFTFLSSEDDVSIFDALAGTSVYDEDNYFVHGVYANASGSSTTTTGDDTVINPVDSISLTEHGLNIQMTYKVIISTLVDGNIGDIGFVTKTFIGSSDPSAITAKGAVLILRKQVATNLYREVTVKGLTHINAIYNGYSVVTDIDNLIADSDEHNLIIPLHYGVAKRFGLGLRNELYQESLIMVINAVDISRLAWYQTSAFKMVYTIVMVVIAAVSLQPWIAGLVGAAEWGVSMLLLYLLQSITVMAAMKYATVAIAKEFGPDKLLVTAILLMAAAVVTKGKGAIELLNLTLPTAETFMFLGSIVMEASGVSTQRLLEEAQDDYNDFILDAEAQMEVLEAAQEELDMEYTLPISYLEPPNYPSPDLLTKAEDFYNKIHIGNIGTLSLNVIENYVDTSLALPSGVIIN